MEYALIVLVTAIIFYYLGRFSVTKQDEKVAKKILEKSKKKKIDAGAIKPLTPEQRRKRGTNQEAVEEEMSNLFKGLLKR